jgi:hypothetical protein
MDRKQRNDEIIKNFLYPKRVLAEEVLHKNPDAKILPSLGDPGKLNIDDMVPIFHKPCRRVAFFYTHKPKTGELMMASRAMYANGSQPERNQKMVCGGCGAKIDYEDELII